MGPEKYHKQKRHQRGSDRANEVYDDITYTVDSSEWVLVVSLASGAIWHQMGF